MLYAILNQPATYQSLLNSPLWQKAFQWLKNLPADLENGEYAIQGRDLFANVFYADTLPRTKAIVESHRQYADLHYCRSDSEIIEWLPAGHLTIATPYDPLQDVALYALPPKAPAIRLVPGSFAIFLPEEAHIPKIAAGAPQRIQKIVIKIKADLL